MNNIIIIFRIIYINISIKKVAQFLFINENIYLFLIKFIELNINI